MKTRTWSIVALVLSLLICVVAVFTSFTDDATYFSRLHTTIIDWHLPLVAIGVIIYSFISEREDSGVNIFAWVSVIFMVVAMFFTNITKNTVQDVCSNIGNYVDIATSVIEEESGNVIEYGEKLERTVDIAEKRITNDRKAKIKTDEYYDHYNYRKDSKKDTAVRADYYYGNEVDW